MFSSEPEAAASVQTLRDILVRKKPPERLLEHSDVEFCKGVPEPVAVEALPAKIPFLMIVGVSPRHRFEPRQTRSLSSRGGVHPDVKVRMHAENLLASRLGSGPRGWDSVIRLLSRTFRVLQKGTK